MKRLFMLFVMAMAPLAMSAQDNSQQVHQRKLQLRPAAAKTRKMALHATKTAKARK